MGDQASRWRDWADSILSTLEVNLEKFLSAVKRDANGCHERSQESVVAGVRGRQRPTTLIVVRSGPVRAPARRRPPGRLDERARSSSPGSGPGCQAKEMSRGWTFGSSINSVLSSSGPS